jgi:hypothetical protein
LPHAHGAQAQVTPADDAEDDGEDDDHGSVVAGGKP